MTEGQPQQRSMGKVAAYTALTQLTMPLTALATAPILARELGAHGRGEMAAAVAPVFILMWIAGMGLPEASAYAIAKLKQHPRIVLERVARLSLVYGVVAAALVWFGAPYLLHQTPEVVPLMRGIGLLLPVMIWVNILRAVVVGIREYGPSAVERTFTPVLRLVSLVVLLLTGHMTVTTATWAHTITSLVGSVYLLLVVLRHKVEADQVSLPARRLTREIAVFGLRGWGAVLGNLVSWRLDQTILVALVSPKELGYYVVAVAFAEIGGMAVMAVRGVVFAEAAHRDSRELIARSARVMTAIAVLAAIGGCVVAEPVIRIFFGADFLPAVGLTQVLLVANVPFSLVGVIAAGVYAEGYPGKLSVSQLVAAAVTAASLVALAPVMGAMGAAVASLLAYTVGCVMTMVQYHRITGISYRQMSLIDGSDIGWVTSEVRRVLAKRRGGELEVPPVVARADAEVSG